MPAEVSVSAMYRFLDAKGLRRVCAQCGQEEFNVHDEKSTNNRPALLAPRFPGTELRDAGLAEVVYLWCRNCGFAQFYNRKVVTEWLAANPTH